MVYESVERLLTLLFPPACCACGDAGLGRYDICAPCYRELPRLRLACEICAEPLPAPASYCGRCLARPPRFHRVRTPYLYAAPVDGLVLGLKFNGRLARGRLLGELLARHLLATGASADLLLPVPLHLSRLRERGFNQAMELARPVAQRLGIPLSAGTLRRVRRTATQSELPFRQRGGNVRNAFSVRGRLDDLRIAVVDDVVTTGNTADAVARALRAAGAARVEIWAPARAGRLVAGAPGHRFPAET